MLYMALSNHIHSFNKNLLNEHYISFWSGAMSTFTIRKVSISFLEKKNQSSERFIHWPKIAELLSGRVVLNPGFSHLRDPALSHSLSHLTSLKTLIPNYFTQMLCFFQAAT